ncbi:phage tail protein, partial [Vibrio fluvialis]|uniref:phage tail protein n=1 Tax=Vibrio fluvialis TaxID=676 RepID=UPI001F44CD43
MSLLITHAGIAAAIRAGDLGIEYKITHISIGSAGYVPNPEQTSLVAEIQKKAITRGALVAQGQLHFETVWDGDEEFEGKELGYWLEDGTLFAVDSRDGEVITYKRKNTVVTEACELNLAASTIENITVEMLGSPYATEQVAGIAKVVTTGQVDTGTDDRAFLTVKKFLYALDVTTVVDKLVTNLWLKLAARIVPVGAAIPWFTDIAPDGFGMFKGQAFDMATYPELAKVFPDGIIPDMRGCGV